MLIPGEGQGAGGGEGAERGECTVTHPLTWGSVWAAKAKHVREMICSVSLEEDFYPCSSVEAGGRIPPGLKLTCPVSQRQGVTALKKHQAKK